MSNFKIPKIPSTTQRSIRFPNNLIEDVENLIVGKDCTFSAFIIEATRYCVDEINDYEKIVENHTNNIDWIGGKK